MIWTLLMITSLAGGPTDRVIEDRTQSAAACAAEAARDIARLPPGEQVGVFSCSRSDDDYAPPLTAPLPLRKPQEIPQ